MISIRDKDRGAPIGTITEQQLDLLREHLEEESMEDAEYYLDADTLDMLAERGVDAGLIDLLRGALGDREGMEIAWSRT